MAAASSIDWWSSARRRRSSSAAGATLLGVLTGEEKQRDAGGERRMRRGRPPGWRVLPGNETQTLAYMIGCDDCDGWFHGPCVGVGKQAAETIDMRLPVRDQKGAKYAFGPPMPAPRRTRRPQQKYVRTLLAEAEELGVEMAEVPLIAAFARAAEEWHERAQALQEAEPIDANALDVALDDGETCEVEAESIPPLRKLRAQFVAWACAPRRRCSTASAPSTSRSPTTRSSSRSSCSAAPAATAPATAAASPAAAAAAMEVDGGAAGGGAGGGVDGGRRRGGEGRAQARAEARARRRQGGREGEEEEGRQGGRRVAPQLDRRRPPAAGGGEGHRRVRRGRPPQGALVRAQRWRTARAALAAGGPLESMATPAAPPPRTATPAPPPAPVDGEQEAALDALLSELEGCRCGCSATSSSASLAAAVDASRRGRPALLEGRPADTELRALTDEARALGLAELPEVREAMARLAKANEWRARASAALGRETNVAHLRELLALSASVPCVVAEMQTVQERIEGTAGWKRRATDALGRTATLEEVT